jgi:peptide methionine sulfoxide reductase msrA/msrB
MHSFIKASFLLLFTSAGCQTQTDTTMEFNKLTPEEERIIVHKGTEAPFSGKYVNHKADGTYHCKRCDAALFTSASKFESHCGWPSFDDQVEKSVKMVLDADGRRTEIVCAQCGGHLGHVFYGEGFTNKDTRYCVNSLSLQFESEGEQMDTAYFAAGCFWGVEYYLQKAKGVISAESGYMGGHMDNPTYDEVCTGRSGHAETVRVIFDTKTTDFSTLVKLFFEIHDFTQVNRQGPDVGTQYRSAIFYKNIQQKEQADEIITLLKHKGYKVATSLETASKFFLAESYHQNYYFKKGGVPYCHMRKEIF